MGYGLNGQACYVDRPDYPYPGVTFLETTPDYLALKEKEKGDWKNLTVAEIKQCKIHVVQYPIFLMYLPLL